jgi:transposase
MSLSEKACDTGAIDLGSSFHMAAVNPSLSESPICRFGVDTGSLRDMALWMAERHVKRVAIEATGVYWMPVYEVLELAGLEVVLVDGGRAMSLPGRTKTDVSDAAWLEKLLSHGMLNPAFVPDGEIIPLRTYRRLWQQCTEKASAEILRMQKAFQQMNVRLDKAVTDITGVTGMRITKAIIGGERDPKRLASLRLKSVKMEEAEIAKALDGHFQDQYVFALRLAVDEYERQMDNLKQIDEQIQRELDGLAALHPAPASDFEPKKTKARRNKRSLTDLRSRICSLAGGAVLSVPGIDAPTVLTLLGECGIDLSRWPTEKHYVSWLGLCPQHRITGGKVKRSKTKRVRNDAATAFRLAAQSLIRSSSALGAMLRHIAYRKGMPKAVTAIARILATLYYRAIRYQTAYDDAGGQLYEERYRQHTLKRMAKTAQKLGYQLVPLNLQTVGVS